MSSLGPIRYLGTGDARVDSASFELAFAELVESVLARLAERGINGSVLEDEWGAIRDADAEEREYCVAAARLGFDPYSVDAAIAEIIPTAAEHLDAELLHDFLDAVAPSKLAQSMRWVDDGSKIIERHPSSPNDQLEKIQKAFAKKTWPDAHGLPWKNGWAQAQHAREVLGLGDMEPLDLGTMIPIRERKSDDRGLQGLGGTTSEGGSALVLRRHFREPDAQFARARGLWHVTNPQSASRFLLTTSHADPQRTERAFAAEFIAPASGIAQLLEDPDDVVTFDEVSDIASHFRVSQYVVRHQIENQIGRRVVS